jgi:hypothetical protein
MLVYAQMVDDLPLYMSLKRSVDSMKNGSSNFYTVGFEVFKKPGLPCAGKTPMQ